MTRTYFTLQHSQSDRLEAEMFITMQNTKVLSCLTNSYAKHLMMVVLLEKGLKPKGLVPPGMYECPCHCIYA